MIDFFQRIWNHSPDTQAVIAISGLLHIFFGLLWVTHIWEKIDSDNVEEARVLLGSIVLFFIPGIYLVIALGVVLFYVARWFGRLIYVASGLGSRKKLPEAKLIKRK